MKLTLKTLSLVLLAQACSAGAQTVPRYEFRNAVTGIKVAPKLPASSPISAPPPAVAPAPDPVLASSLSHASLTFLEQEPGVTSSPQTTTLTNTGNQPLALTSPSVMGDPSTFRLQTSCGSVLQPGQACDYTVTFTPYSPAPPGALLVFNTNQMAGAGQFQVPLYGTVRQTFAALSSETISFAATEVGTSTEAAFISLLNLGTANLAIGPITMQGSTAFSVSRQCMTTLPAGEECFIMATFTPQSTGLHQATVTVESSSSTGPLVLTLSGEGR